MEPLGPRLHRGPGAPQLIDVAAAGAAALVLLSTGDAFLLAVLLGLAAGRLAAGVTAASVAVALLARWGSSSLAAAAGAQAVLGPALVVGPGPALLSGWCAAAALLLAAPPGRTAVAFGAAAGLVVAGPGVTTVGNAAIRVIGLAAGAAIAVQLVPRLPVRARRYAPALGLLSAALVVLS